MVEPPTRVSESLAGKLGRRGQVHEPSLVTMQGEHCASGAAEMMSSPLHPIVFKFAMPANNTSVGKRKGQDPELAQLLKMVLAKLDDVVGKGSSASEPVQDPRPRRREGTAKKKDVKDISSKEKRPKVEESITNWLFGFNVFMTVMLEKRPDLAAPMIFYANKILKAHQTYGESAW
ncbi:hypothetical protein NDU88_001692 [Pleurodeles waltl]|uniref:Uncharacterized protein n=1 Tax=Pleurodeles waltl TaxID=8319 RepID=A0AAV7SAK7_PLEWA|nr:hypothetical protein NDU88_001692 [Pleurodeles waltl]